VPGAGRGRASQAELEGRAAAVFEAIGQAGSPDDFVVDHQIEQLRPLAKAVAGVDRTMDTGAEVTAERQLRRRDETIVTEIVVRGSGGKHHPDQQRNVEPHLVLPQHLQLGCDLEIAETEVVGRGVRNPGAAGLLLREHER
jgi:hypothetical protein